MFVSLIAIICDPPGGISVQEAYRKVCQSRVYKLPLFHRRPSLLALTRPLSTPPQEATDGAHLPLYNDLRFPFSHLLERTTQITIEVGLVSGVRSKVPASCLPYHNGNGWKRLQYIGIKYWLDTLYRSAMFSLVGRGKLSWLKWLIQRLENCTWTTALLTGSTWQDRICCCPWFRERDGTGRDVFWGA